MREKLSCSVSVHEEELDGKKIFVVDCAELGVSDYGDSLDTAIENLKKGINLLLEDSPDKEELLVKQEPLMVTRVFL
jgi:predicted RNase H-like HicB family nuclease